MEELYAAFIVDAGDNVATALSELKPGAVPLRGDRISSLTAEEPIPAGYKVAIEDIQKGEDIIKYGVCIGRATENIRTGTVVHLNNMRSVCDERSSHMDERTGAPKDTRYE